MDSDASIAQEQRYALWIRQSALRCSIRAAHKSQDEGISRSDAVAWVKASGESAVSTMVPFARQSAGHQQSDATPGADVRSCLLANQNAENPPRAPICRTRGTSLPQTIEQLSHYLNR